MSREFFYRDRDGEKGDADLHEPILNNTEADEQIAVTAVDRAIALLGVSRRVAERAYSSSSTIKDRSS